MTDSQFLYQMMVKANAMRASALAPATPKMEDILASVGHIVRVVEAGAPDVIDARDACLETAAMVLRLAVERIGHATPTAPAASTAY